MRGGEYSDLCGGDFRTTCRVLAEQFRPALGGLAFPESRVRESFATRRSFEELASQYAVPSESNWPIAHEETLHEARERTLDELMELETKMEAQGLTTQQARDQAWEVVRERYILLPPEDAN